MDSRDPRVLILSNPSDPHGFAVEAGLQVKGIHVQIWHTSDWPTLQSGSLELASTGISYDLRGPELRIQGERITTVWDRRPLPPSLPDHLEPADRAFALRENALFVRSMNTLFGAGAFVVNPPSSNHLTLLRPAQLQSAIRSGFSIPRTLCSNDPERIRAFVRQAPRGAIFKSFFPMTWETDIGKAILFTSEVKEKDLVEDEALAVCPGIFQELIPKAFELRVTAIGQRLFAAKLRSQEIEDARLDYRAVLDEIPMEPYELPESVASACRQVSAELGIVFGCFDLIVTPSGEYVFLEVNEMGAFLWVEERLPELKLLDAFCEFLAQGRSDFEWKETTGSIRAADFAQIVEEQLTKAPTLHVVPQRKRAVDPAS